MPVWQEDSLMNQTSFWDLKTVSGWNFLLFFSTTASNTFNRICVPFFRVHQHSGQRSSPLVGSSFWVNQRNIQITKIFDSCSLKTFLVECNCNANTGAIVRLLVTTQGFSANQVAAARCSWACRRSNQASVQNQKETLNVARRLVPAGLVYFRSCWFPGVHLSGLPRMFREEEKNQLWGQKCPSDGRWEENGRTGSRWYLWTHVEPWRPQRAQNRKERLPFTHSSQLDNREDKAGVTSLHFRSGIFWWSFLAGQCSNAEVTVLQRPPHSPE